MTSNISEMSIWCYVSEIYYFYIFLYTKKPMYDKSKQIALGHVWTDGCQKWWSGTEQRTERKTTAILTSFCVIRKIIGNRYTNNSKAKMKSKKKKKKCENEFFSWPSMRMSIILQSFHAHFKPLDKPLKQQTDITRNQDNIMT